MLRKLNLFNRYLLVLVLLVALVAVGLPVQSAHATSVYDNVIQPVDKLELYAPGCSTTDYSSNWIDSFISNYSTLNYGAAAMSKSQAVSLFNNKTAWGVSVQGVSGSGHITIWWTDSDTASINFHTYSSFPQAVAEKTGTGTYALIVVSLDPGCAPYISSSNYTTGNGSYTVAFDPNDEVVIGQTMKIWRQSASVNYPSGYAGALINKHIDGNVICTWGSTDISRINILTDNGQNGYALLSDGGVLGTHYSYYLTDPDDWYRIDVECDGEMGHGPAVSNTTSSSLNWGCTYESQLHSYLCSAI